MQQVVARFLFLLPVDGIHHRVDGIHGKVRVYLVTHDLHLQFGDLFFICKAFFELDPLDFPDHEGKKEYHQPERCPYPQRVYHKGLT